MKNLFNYFASGLLMICLSLTAFSQEKGDKLKELLNKQQYIFNVTSATSQGGRTVQLTSEYELIVSKDSIISYLPFFGRAYSAPYNPSSNDGGIKFTSKKFKYSSTINKKNAWSIIIKPNDVESVNSLRLDISDGGYGTLTIISNQRSPISYYGYVISSEKD